MNELINKLAVQAGGIWRGGYVEQANGDSVYTDRKFVDGADMDVEQFAKLIVIECIRSVRGVDLSDVDGGDEAVINACAENVKKKFGVE